LFLLLLPAAVWLEKSEAQTWNQRLLWPSLVGDPDRHTPLHPLGYFLPPQITKNIQLGPNDNPVILAGTTKVAKNASLTIAPGTHIFVHEYGQLLVEGTANLNGTSQQPIVFTTNERHAANRTWGGIVISQGSSAAISHAEFRYASPAISCMGSSAATISDVEITLAQLGLFLKNASCRLANINISNVYDGISAVGFSDNFSAVNISAKHKNILETVPTAP